MFDHFNSFQDLPTKSGTSRGLINEDNVSEISYELPQIELPMHLIISEEDLATVLDEQSTIETPLPKNITVEEEVKLLRSKLRDLQHSPSASREISMILVGKSQSLQFFKTFKEKEDLLIEAISSKNGDAVLKVVLFLERTLKKKMFYRLLQTHPESLGPYINYLLLRLKVTDYTDLLVMLGRQPEATLLQFSVYVKNTSNYEIKRQRLKKMYADYFSQPGSNGFYSQIVANYINLLEFQLAEKASGHAGASEIVDKSVLETLYDLCGRFKWTTDHHASQSVENPYKLAENHQISTSQFEWIALNERGQKQAWLDLDGIFEKKGWLNLKSKKTFAIHIPLDRAILRLYSLNAPDPVMNTFLGQVEDPQRRLALAKKVLAKKGIVDALVACKDKIELENYKNSLDAGTEERFYAENALKSFGNKWKV